VSNAAATALGTIYALGWTGSHRKSGIRYGADTSAQATPLS